MLLTKEQILNATLKKADIEAFGGTVRIRELTSKEREDYEQFVSDIGKRQLTNIRSRLLAYCIVDNEGTPMFSEKEVDSLNKLSSSDVDYVWKEIQKLSGIANENDTEKN
jgi:hypothetical protein